MDKLFYGKQVDRLKSVYHQGSINEERINLLWRRFKEAPNHVFENAVNYIISECTTTSMPPISRFVEAVNFCATKAWDGAANMLAHESPFICEPCKDFGYGFVDDLVVRCCTCIRGSSINPEELSKAQAQYNKGIKIMERTAPGILKELPYDPTERISFDIDAVKGCLDEKFLREHPGVYEAMDDVLKDGLKMPRTLEAYLAAEQIKNNPK